MGLHDSRATKRRGRPADPALRLRGLPYTMRLQDGRTVFVEIPRRMVASDRSGEPAFTPEGVRFLDRVRSLALEPAAPPSPAFLVSLRQALGLTQAELGSRIGRNRLTISRWERGSMRPGDQAIQKLYALARSMKHAGVVLAG